MLMARNYVNHILCANNDLIKTTYERRTEICDSWLGRIRQGEPQKRECSEAWKVAIGLQQVDRLQTSEYLLDTAKRHIEGDISINEAKQLISVHYALGTFSRDRQK